jgi:hypothetical protein
MSHPASAPASAGLIDPRGPRFGAVITSVLLIVVLVLGPTSVAGLIVLLVQTLAFASGSLLGLQAQPWGLAYRRFVRPRLGAPAELEASEPPRFAQTVGLIFALAGLAGWVFNLAVLFWIAIGFALVAALLNAVFDFCLGCELYLLGKRLTAKPASSRAS